MGPMGPQGPQGPAGAGTQFTIVDITVPEGQWQYSNIPETDEDPGNNYFFAEIDMKDVITADIAKGGLIKMYRLYGWSEDQKGNTVYTDFTQQVELPYVRPSEYWYDGTDQEGKPTKFVGNYTETVDYQFGVGTLTIFYTASDFDYEVSYYTPVEMRFRCVIMY